MLSKFLDPKNRFAFKNLFGTHQHKDILIHFINDMIEFKDNAVIQSVEFIKPVRDPDISYAKQSIVDALCTDLHGKKYIVQLEVTDIDFFVKRAQYYAAKAYSSIQNLQEIIFFAITTFEMFPNKPEYKSDHVILDNGPDAKELKNFYYCFLELPKFKKTINELTTITDKWAYFLKNASYTTESELSAIVGNDPAIGHAYQAVNQFAWSLDDLSLYEQMVKRERDAQSIINQKKAEGFAEGFAQGKAERAKLASVHA